MPDTQSVPEPIEVSALREGDVLLSYGVGGERSVSYWCRFFDGGSYSHAAYWDGERVIEAVGEGVRRVGIELHLEEHEYVDVYRFVNGGLDPTAAVAISERARSYLGAKYATSQLGSIALLVGLGRLTGVPPVMEFLASPMGATLKREVRGWNADATRSPMVCSQLVASAFYEGTPEHEYALEIRLNPGRIAEALDDDAADLVLPEPGNTGDPLLDELMRDCQRALLQFSSYDEDGECWSEAVCEGDGEHSAETDAPETGSPGTPASQTGVAETLGFEPRERTAGDEILLTRVTPADLERSPSLERVGRLSA